MKHELPFTEQTALKNYAVFAFAVGVLQAQEQYSEHFLIHRFLKLSPEFDSWQTTKWIFLKRWKCFTVRHFLYLSEKRFLNGLKKRLLRGYYIQFSLNERYVPNRRCYQKRNFLHDSYVYGFDEEAGVFLMYGYNQTLQFQRETIDFHVLYNAYRRSITTYAFWHSAFRVKPQFDFQTYSRNKIEKDLCYTYQTKNAYYGRQLYRMLIERLETGGELNLRYYRYLIEQKQLISRLAFLDKEALAVNQKLLTLANIAFTCAIRLSLLSEKDVEKTAAAQERLAGVLREMLALESRFAAFLYV